jgi:hypothetical protein
MSNCNGKRAAGERSMSVMAGAVGAALALAAAPAGALRFETEGGVQVDFETTISLGAQVRLQNPSVTNIGNDNGGAVPTTGAIGGRVAGAMDPAFSNPDFNFLNGDDGNLNYKRGDITSLALKGTHDLGFKWGSGWKALARATWVYDAKVDDTRRTPLSGDAKNLAQHNVTLLDLWLSKDLKLIDDQPATVKLGNQVISWGEDVFIIGGVNSINALDLRKYHTPGTQLKEIFRPAPMLYLNTGLTQGLNLEGYYQFTWNGFQFDPVGTFFSTADVIGKGQRPAYIPSSLLTPFGLCLPPTPCGDIGDRIQPGINVIPFEGDKKPPAGRQYGLALRGKPRGMDAEFALYYIRYHDKLPFTTLFTDPNNPTYANANVLAAGYYNEFGKDKDLIGVSFNTKVGPVAVGGELSYRPRDSVGIDPSVPATGPYSIFDAQTPGATKTVDPNGRVTVRGFVDEKKYQAHLTGFYFIEVNSPLGAVMKGLGAAEGYVLAEAAVTHYPDLDPSKIPYLIFPSYEIPTRTSAGYVIEIGLTYPHAFGSGVNLTPQIDFTHDVTGISPNTLPFVKGRKSLFLGVNYDIDSVWRGQIGMSRFFGGGLTNAIRDRSFFSASVSYSF